MLTSTIPNYARDGMLRAIAEANSLCYHAQCHYQQAASADISALFDDNDQTLNCAVQEATIGTVKLQRSFSLIHQNAHLNQHFPVLMAQAGSIHIVELDRLSSAIALANHSNDKKISLYSNMMQFIHKREHICVYQKSLLAAVDVQIRSESPYMTDSWEGADRRREQFPANYRIPPRPQGQSIIPIEVAETECQSFFRPPPSYPHTYAYRGCIRSGRGAVERNYHSAIHRPSIVTSMPLRPEHEFEPLPLVDGKDAEDTHIALPSALETVYPITPDNVFRQSEERGSINRTSSEVMNNSYFPADAMIVLHSTTNNQVSSEQKVSTKSSDLRFDLPQHRQQKQEKNCIKDSRDHQDHHNDSFALALGGRDDFIRKEFHHAHSKSDITFYDYECDNGHQDDANWGHDHDGNSHKPFDNFLARYRSHSL